MGNERIKTSELLHKILWKIGVPRHFDRIPKNKSGNYIVPHGFLGIQKKEPPQIIPYSPYHSVYHQANRLLSTLRYDKGFMDFDAYHAVLVERPELRDPSKPEKELFLEIELLQTIPKTAEDYRPISSPLDY